MLALKQVTDTDRRLAPGPHPRGFLPFGPVAVLLCLPAAALGAAALLLLRDETMLVRDWGSAAGIAGMSYGAILGVVATLFWCAWMKHRTVHRYRGSGDLIAVGMVAGIPAYALWAAIWALTMCILGKPPLALRFLMTVPLAVFPGPLLGLPAGFLWWIAAALWYWRHRRPCERPRGATTNDEAADVQSKE